MDTSTSYDLRDFLTGHSSSQDALIKHLKKAAKPKRNKRNRRPEREMQKSIFTWSKENGFQLAVTDASQFNHMYESPFPPGHSDLTGDDRNGIAVYIEVKAPKRLKTLSNRQYDFLKSKIERGCFGIVSDSVERTAEIYSTFINYRRSNNKSGAIEYLLSQLPPPTNPEEDFDLDI